MFPHPKKEDQQALLLTMLIEGTKYHSEEDKEVLQTSPNTKFFFLEMRGAISLGGTH